MSDLEHGDKDEPSVPATTKRALAERVKDFDRTYLISARTRFEILIGEIELFNAQGAVGWISTQIARVEWGSRPTRTRRRRR